MAGVGAGILAGEAGAGVAGALLLAVAVPSAWLACDAALLVSAWDAVSDLP
jgi:hypothetical protein